MFSGFYNLPFNPQPSTPVTEDAFGDFGFTFDALLSQYAPRFGGSNFMDFLRGTGRRQAEQQFNEKNAGILAGGGSIFDLMDPTSFLKTWNPTAEFGSLRPQDRGENPGAFSPFTVFRRR